LCEDFLKTPRAAAHARFNSRPYHRLKHSSLEAVVSSARSPLAVPPLTALLAAALTLATVAAAPAAAPAARDARDVPLVDQRGTTFTLRSLHRPTAVVFVDTDCHDACAVAEGVFARLAGALQRARLDARLVTVTLDPDNEPPVVMAAAARTFNANPARWRWASGAPANVKDLMHAFGVVRASKTYHSTFAYVLDARGLPARVIPLSTSTDTELLAALRAAAQHG
jgi:cytochrome oxidase Cu insertion factor (SCO1/SenC/PrrC family)